MSRRCNSIYFHFNYRCKSFAHANQDPLRMNIQKKADSSTYISHQIQRPLHGRNSLTKKKHSFILHRRRHHFRRRRKFTPLPDLGAVFPKNDWNGDEDQSNEAEEGTSPIDTESVEHVHAEQREDSSGEGSEEGVCCYC